MQPELLTPHCPWHWHSRESDELSWVWAVFLCDSTRTLWTQLGTAGWLALQSQLTNSGRVGLSRKIELHACVGVCLVWGLTSASTFTFPGDCLFTSVWSMNMSKPVHIPGQEEETQSRWALQKLYIYIYIYINKYLFIYLFNKEIRRTWKCLESGMRVLCRHTLWITPGGPLAERLALLHTQLSSAIPGGLVDRSTQKDTLKQVGSISSFWKWKIEIHLINFWTMTKLYFLKCLCLDIFVGFIIYVCSEKMHSFRIKKITVLILQISWLGSHVGVSF